MSCPLIIQSARQLGSVWSIFFSPYSYIFITNVLRMTGNSTLKMFSIQLPGLLGKSRGMPYLGKQHQMWSLPAFFVFTEKYFEVHVKGQRAYMFFLLFNSQSQSNFSWNHYQLSLNGEYIYLSFMYSKFYSYKIKQLSHNLHFGVTGQKFRQRLISYSYKSSWQLRVFFLLPVSVFTFALWWGVSLTSPHPTQADWPGLTGFPLAASQTEAALSGSHHPCVTGRSRF